MFSALRSIVQEVSAATDLQETLRIIVTRVRAAVGTEVCTVYLYDPDTDSYVFMATEGLNRQMEGKFSLLAGEGLVSQVARREEPLNLDDAAQHPSFKSVEGIGEEPFKAFLGVPIIHHREVLGVLIVQQRESRRFVEDEEAFLVTISAQLAGVIAHARATGAVLARKQDETPLSASFRGVAGSPGIGIGTAVVIVPQADLGAVPQRQCKDPETEIEQFQAAATRVRKELIDIRRNLKGRVRPEELALFDVYLMLLDDKALSGEVIERIRRGSWAQGALSDVVLEHVKTFEMMEDEYLSGRATDIRELGRRVLGHLQNSTRGKIEYPRETVLVGEEIPPAVLVDVPEEQLVGVVSTSGSSNSHVAILSRGMGVATVMGAIDLPFTHVDGMRLIVDGYQGLVLSSPTADLLAEYQALQEEESERNRDLASYAGLSAETLDGYKVALLVNTGLMSDAILSMGKDADGVGLYRTEVPFMMRERFPTEEEQRQIYRAQLKAFAPRPVTMRTLDIGGDKALPYFPIKEENPFLGWRGIRVTLDHPEIFLAQVRAMLKASEGLNNLRIMLPMITSLCEVDEACGLIERAHAEIVEEGGVIEMPPVGVMIEVPSAVYSAENLARRVDFLSVGSNDLTQYLLAVDRNNPRVAELYHAYHPAVLRALQHVVDAGHLVHKEVSICGELAGDPGGALLLLAMGFDGLSMNAASLLLVKSVVRRFTLENARQLLSEVMTLDDAAQIRKLIAERLASHGVSDRLLSPGV